MANAHNGRALDTKRLLVTSVVQIVEHPRRLRRSAWVSQSLLRHIALVVVVLELGVRDNEGSGLAGALVAFSATQGIERTDVSHSPTIAA